MQRITGQSGNALVTTLFLTALAVLAVGVLMDFVGIYVAKRVGRTAADAAALGAMAAVEQAFDDVAQPALQARVAALMQRVASEVSSRMQAWEEDRRAALRSSLEQVIPPLSEPDIEAQINKAIAEERPGVYKSTRRSVIRSKVADPAVADALIDGQPVPMVPGLGEFFTATERGCLIRAAGQQGADSIRAAATWFAQQNGGQDLVTVSFPYENAIRARVIVSARVPLGLTARFAPAAKALLPVEAVSGAELGIPVDMSGPC
jgi:uncharacterized membrane protein